MSQPFHCYSLVIFLAIDFQVSMHNSSDSHKSRVAAWLQCCLLPHLPLPSLWPVPDLVATSYDVCAAV